MPEIILLGLKHAIRISQPGITISILRRNWHLRRKLWSLSGPASPEATCIECTAPTNAYMSRKESPVNTCSIQNPPCDLVLLVKVRLVSWPKASLFHPIHPPCTLNAQLGFVFLGYVPELGLLGSDCRVALLAAAVVAVNVDAARGEPLQDKLADLVAARATEGVGNLRAARPDAVARNNDAFRLRAAIP
eukprot:6176160-Pleurochrysis_carterae.AAC.1